ncbi:2-C-methyl-D-erythritol 4-phosphate cytidylyltransferase [Kocuria palustris]|uniref:IspD/TarI family cytidylyltransferase n=1 Tax=Kocuria palustris TaxID=71999 RepID=UPI0011A3DC7B|nr:2-C-methyl-D-erythritol 4-phosphate cytidylyltransferase [Kocuria palustris]
MDASGPQGSATAHPSSGTGCAVVVVAAGSGTRLGRGMPKALVEIAGRSILERSLQGVLASGVCPDPGRIVVTVPAGDRALSAVCRRFGVQAVPGGDSRAASVRAALEAIARGPAPAEVLVHDAARCLTPPSVFREVAAALGEHRAVIPVLPVIDTMRAIDDRERLSGTVDRARLRAIQTPQGFEWPLLRELSARAAAEGLDDAAVTDDASLVERYTDLEVVAVAGHEESFKVTRPLDLLLAEAVVAARGAAPDQEHRP